MDEELENKLKSMLHSKFPQFLKEFLNEFAKTKFYKKTLESRRWGYEEVPDDFYFFDYKAPRLLSDKSHSEEEWINSLLEYGIFGELPHYQHDELKTIVINFKDKEAYLERGLATGLWASEVVRHTQKIPKYMKPLIHKLWVDYEKYIHERSDRNG